MKKILLPILLVLTIAPAFAQKNFILSHLDRRGYLNLSGGASMPVGSLFAGDPASASDLKSVRGSSIQIAAGYRLTRLFGVVASMTNCLNNANTLPMVENVAQGQFGTNWAAKGGAWNCSHLMLGPTINLQSGLFMFDGRITGGYSWVQRPSTELKGEFYNVPMVVQTSTERSRSFTVGTGVSVRCKIGRNFALAIHADYLTTRAEFKNVKSVLKIGEDQATDFVRETHPIGMLSLNGGLSLLF